MKIWITKDSDGEVSFFTEKPRRVEYAETDGHFFCAKVGQAFIDESKFDFIEDGECKEANLEII